MSTPPHTQHTSVPSIPPRDTSPDRIADSLARVDFWLVQTSAAVGEGGPATRFPGQQRPGPKSPRDPAGLQGLSGAPSWRYPYAPEGGSPNWAPGSKLPLAQPPQVHRRCHRQRRHRRAKPRPEPSNGRRSRAESDNSSPPQAEELGLFAAGPPRARVAPIGKQGRVKVAGVGAFGAQMGQTGGHHEGGEETCPEAGPTHNHDEPGVRCRYGSQHRAGKGASK